MWELWARSLGENPYECNQMPSPLPKSSDTEETLSPFMMLFRAKWNIPQATEALGFPANERNWEHVKVAFRDWCLTNLADYSQ